MRYQIDSINKLRLARYIGGFQLKDEDSFTARQRSITQRSVRRIDEFLRSPVASEEKASMLIRELHTAFQYYCNTFTVLYKISRKSTDDYSGESYFYPYQEHQLNKDTPFSDPSAYKNEETMPPNRQEIEDLQWTISGSYGLCFAQDAGEILRYLDYGTQLTISILDPFIFPMHKTLVRTNAMRGKQYQVSQAYISENILLDDYRIIKQMLYRANDLDYFFMPSSYDETIENFTSSIAKYPNTGDVIAFMRRIKGLYLNADGNRDLFFQMVESEFPDRHDPNHKTYKYLFNDHEIINKERQWIGISESVEESIENLLKIGS